MNGLYVGLLLQLLLALLGDVELAEQLPEQMKVPYQRRTQVQLGKHAQMNFLVGKFDRVLGYLAEVPRFARGVPEAARDPGKLHQADAGLLHEVLGLGFELRQLGEKIQPAFEWQADRQQIS